MRGWVAGLVLGVALPCSGWAAAPAFRIAGVAVSDRDGSPIPYCRLTATAVVEVAEGDGGRGGFGRQNIAAELEAELGGDFLGSPAGFLGMFGMPNIDQGPGRGAGGGRRGGAVEPENATVADAQGHFSVTVPKAGAWRLTGEARGFRSQSYDQHDRLFYAQVVLTEAAPVYSLTFRMARNAVITGVVYDEAGEPVRGARVSAELVPVLVPGQLPVAARAAGNATTDDRGHYEMATLAPGAYRVRVQAQPWYALGVRGLGMQGRQAMGGGTGTNQNGQANDLGASLDPSLDVVYGTTWFPGADEEAAGETIQLIGGDEREADFHLNAVSAIHLRVPRPEVAAVAAVGANGQGPNGQVRGRPQQQMATVTRVSPDGSVGQVVTIGGSGTGDWDFGGLTPGIYEVRLPGPDGNPGSGEVREIEVQGGSRVVTLDAARALTKVTVKVAGLGGDSFPMVEFVDVETGRRVVAQESRGRGGRGGGRGRRGEDDGGGDQPVPAVERTLTASLPAHRYAVTVGGGIYLTGIAAVDAKVVGRTVEIGGGSPVLTLEVGTGRAQLGGFVREGGKPVEGAMVLLVPISLGQPGDTSMVGRAESNTDGSYGFRGLEPGRYIAVAIEHGWNVEWKSAQMLAGFLGRGVAVELKAGAKGRAELGAVLP